MWRNGIGGGRLNNRCEALYLKFFFFHGPLEIRKFGPPKTNHADKKKEEKKKKIKAFYLHTTNVASQIGCGTG